MILLFIARTCDCALAVGKLAQAQWLYVPSMSCETALYTDTFVCMNRMRVSKPYNIPATRTRFSNDAIVRVPHAQGSESHPSTVLHHLARGNHFTAGPTSESVTDLEAV